MLASERCGSDLLLLRETPADAEAAARVAAERRLAAVAGSDGDIAFFAAAAAGPNAEILLLTSGTTGNAKVVRHARERLLAPLRRRLAGDVDWPRTRWLLAYPPAAFAGLQVILTTLLAGATLVASCGRRYPPLAFRAAVEAFHGRRWTLRAYPFDVGKLGGTTNAQGQRLRQTGGHFLHLELSAELRESLRAEQPARAEFLKALKKFHRLLQSAKSS